tara:strand:+ start:3162 stop:3347 length:186 start_codon:yes stop_codon:yes gene_type:complete
MIEILLILWFSGFNMTISNDMYKFSSLQECNEKKIIIAKDYGAKDATCFKGDIIKDKLLDS